MANSRESILLISDFNVDVMRGYIENDEHLPLLDSTPAPFGQVFQLLLSPELPVWSERPDYTLVWTRPESVLPSFEAALHLQEVSVTSILEEVDHFCDAVADMSSRTNYTFVPTWTMNPRFRGHGMLEMTPGVGVKELLVRANLRLAEKLSESSNLVVLDADRWISTAGINAYNPKLWYLSKVPFDNMVFKAAISDLKAAIRGIRGEARKLVVVDLDDTLWGGIVGDLGWEHIQLGGHDAVGEAFVDFQRSLKALSHKGILLGIVSKNTEEVALNTIRSHPEMVLSLDDFAGWRINWDDKAANVVDLVDELQLGLQSVVFIDDNPAERGRINDALPEILVPEWPANKLMYASALCELDCFDAPALSAEDRNRSRMYSAERVRRQSRRKVTSLDEWLKTLNVKVQVLALDDSNLTRATQLLNKTNQMNLSTRRLTETEFHKWAGDGNNHTWVFMVSDRYGDSGLTGLASVTVEGDIVSITDFILSCRVMGRKIEETMLHVVSNYCATLRANAFIADFIETSKNKPCHDFLLRSGMAQDPGTTEFNWAMVVPYPLPGAIQLRDESQQAQLSSSQSSQSTK